MVRMNYFQFFFTSHFGGWFGGHSKVVKHPNPSQILKGCLSTLLTSLAELICIYTWIFNISWKILLTLHFDLHFGLHQLDNFWTKNEWFGRVLVVRSGWKFQKICKIWFRKIFIRASRLYDLFETPRSLEAARAQSMPRSFRPPYMVLKWLPLVSGCQNWPRPRAASSDLGFSKRSHSLEAGIKILRNQILCIHTKFQLNRTPGTLPNHTFFVQNLHHLWRPK